PLSFRQVANPAVVRRDAGGGRRGQGERIDPARRAEAVMRALAVAACVALGAVDARAENWPQWRGPSFNGISTETNLPVTWTTTENIAWKLPLPAWSGSTPIVWGDRIFLNVAEK